MSCKSAHGFCRGFARFKLGKDVKIFAYVTSTAADRRSYEVERSSRSRRNATIGKNCKIFLAYVHLEGVTVEDDVSSGTTSLLTTIVSTVDRRGGGLQTEATGRSSRRSSGREFGRLERDRSGWRTVGEGAIVGAGSVLPRTSPWTIVAVIPQSLRNIERK